MQACIPCLSRTVVYVSSSCVFYHKVPISHFSTVQNTPFGAVYAHERFFNVSGYAVVAILYMDTQRQVPGCAHLGMGGTRTVNNLVLVILFCFNLYTANTKGEGTKSNNRERN